MGKTYTLFSWQKEHQKTLSDIANYNQIINDGLKNGTAFEDVLKNVRDSFDKLDKTQKIDWDKFGERLKGEYDQYKNNSLVPMISQRQAIASSVNNSHTQLGAAVWNAQNPNELNNVHQDLKDEQLSIQIVEQSTTETKQTVSNINKRLHDMHMDFKEDFRWNPNSHCDNLFCEVERELEKAEKAIDWFINNVCLKTKEEIDYLVTFVDQKQQELGGPIKENNISHGEEEIEFDR